MPTIRWAFADYWPRTNNGLERSLGRSACRGCDQLLVLAAEVGRLAGELDFGSLAFFLGQLLEGVGRGNRLDFWNLLRPLQRAGLDVVDADQVYAEGANDGLADLTLFECEG